MYSNKLVVALRSNGRFLQELNDNDGTSVHVPFGTEYELRIKNQDSTRRVAVKITIDGTDVLDGMQIIVDPKSYVDLERFIVNGNLKKGNRFKFIERTKAVEQYRGVTEDDGLINVEFMYEKKVEPTKYVYKPEDWAPWKKPWSPTPRPPYNPPLTPAPWETSPPWNPFDGPVWMKHDNVTSNQIGTAYASSTVGQTKMRSKSCDVYDSYDVGITAPGSVSNQKFEETAGFVGDGMMYNMVLKLVGRIKYTAVDKANNIAEKSLKFYRESKVTKAMHTRSSITCKMCGKRSKITSTTKFCSNCGAGLILVE